jgi:hypothetical protein
VTRALVLTATVALAGCLDRFEPDVGAPLHAACQDALHDATHARSFANDIAPILTEYHCPNCHTPDGATPIGFEASGFDISTYATLRAGGVRSGMQIVVPGHPCQSVLLEKVSSGPPFGAQMPLSGSPYLEDDDREAISDWLFEGALDN